MYSNEYRNVIYRLNQQFKKSKRRLERDFNISTNLELKKPSEIRNKRELNSYIKSISSFTKKARSYRTYKSGYKITPTKIITPRGVEISKRKVQKLKSEVRRINRYRTARAYKYDLNRKLLKNGKPTDMTIKDFAGLGNTKYNEFKHIKLNLNAIQNEKDYNRMLKRLRNTSTKDFYERRNKRFIQNYKRSLIDTFGNSATYKLRRKINTMTVDEFMDLYYSEVNISFEFTYSFLDSQYKIEQLENIFNV